VKLLAPATGAPGFGGLFGTKALKRADVDITLIGKTSHHLFQPLLYQVATGILSQGEIAPSTREILSRQKNVAVLLGEVTDIDLAAQTVTSSVLGDQTVTAYDSLIVAAGASQSYFGNDHFAEDAVFSSPVAAQLLEDSEGVIRGKAALREYWSEGLRRIPDLRFEG